MFYHNHRQHREAIMYTDGACSHNGYGQASAGIGVYDEYNPDNNISERITGRQTNQRAEIMAATRGILSALDQGYESVLIKLDSTYVKNAAESWIDNWDRRGWTSNNKPVKNKLEFLELQNAMSRIQTSFEWVPSARNRADSLARAGSQQPYPYYD